MLQCKQTVCIILPILNEIDGMRWFMPKITPEWYDQLIVVDGGSTDGSIEYCRELGIEVVPQTGRGLPNALDSAIVHCRTDLVLILSPDGNSLPELIPGLIDKLRQGYDMVTVSRYLDHATSQDDDIFTHFGNWVFTKLINLLFGGGLTDSLGIYRGYRLDAVHHMRLPRMASENWLRRRYFYMNSWEVASSIRALRLGLRVMEIPGDEPKRIGGVKKSFFLVNGLGVLAQILNDFLLFKRRPSSAPTTHPAGS